MLVVHSTKVIEKQVRRPYELNMSKNIKCNACDQLATVHLTQIVDKQIHKIDLCEECAKAKGVADPEGFSFSDMFTGALDAAAMGPEGELACGTCGFTHADFRKSGRFGCADCYSSFESILEETLEGMHPGLHHCGKVPQIALGRIDEQSRIRSVERSLREAVESEDYEGAARFRDELAALRLDTSADRASMEASS